MEVHRGATLCEEGRQALHVGEVGGRVCHRHRQLPAARRDFGMQGIVNIDGARGINRDKGQCGEIHTRCIFQRLTLGCGINERLGRLLAPLLGQARTRGAVAVLDAGRGLVAEAFQDLGRGFAVFDRVPQQCTGDEVARRHAVASVRRNKQPAGKSCEVWHHKSSLALLHDMAHEFIEPGFDQTFDFGDRAPRFVMLALDRFGGADANGDFVPGQDF